MMILALLFSLAVTPAELYDQGNRHFENREFPRAIASYQQALSMAQSPDIYYNLGNAYFKEGQLGRAVMNYRRGRVLAPRDPDINSNLTFVRNYRADKLLSQTGPIDRIIYNVLHYFSYYESAVLSLFLLGLGSLLISLFIVYRKRILLYSSIAAGLVFLYFFAVQGVWHGEIRSSPAVVVVPEADALSGPGDDYKQVLLLHDGTEVSVKNERNGYYLIQLPGGSGGWLKKGSLERIY